MNDKREMLRDAKVGLLVIGSGAVGLWALGWFVGVVLMGMTKPVGPEHFAAFFLGVIVFIFLAALTGGSVLIGRSIRERLRERAEAFERQQAQQEWLGERYR